MKHDMAGQWDAGLVKVNSRQRTREHGRSMVKTGQ